MTDKTEALPPLPEPFTINEAEEAFVRDFCPYKGSPDPLIVWKAAWASCSAALAQRQQVPEGWQPIETAPDEVNFHALVASPLDAGGHYVEEAWWCHERREWWPANTDHTDAHGCAVYPTHWMPLPAAPALTAAPSAQAEPVRQLHSFSSIDCEKLIAATVPGGSACDPQEVADSIRRYLNAWPAAQAEPQVPLTEAEVFHSDDIMAVNADAQLGMIVLMQLVRAIERAHGIGKT